MAMVETASRMAASLESSHNIPGQRNEGGT